VGAAGCGRGGGAGAWVIGLCTVIVPGGVRDCKENVWVGLVCTARWRESGLAGHETSRFCGGIGAEPGRLWYLQGGQAGGRCRWADGLVPD
jgi:hypothetical protein